MRIGFPIQTMQDHRITQTQTEDKTIIVIEHRRPQPDPQTSSDREHKDWQMLIFFALVISLGLAALSGN